MRFNIERHVWTQHVRKNVPGMDQSNYVARLHKAYVERYVVMAEDSTIDFNAHEFNQELGLQRSIVSQKTLTDTAVSANSCFQNSFCQPASSPIQEDQLNGLEGIARLSHVLHGAPANTLQIGGGNGSDLKKELEWAQSCPKDYFSEIAEATTEQRQSFDLGKSFQDVNGDGGQAVKGFQDTSKNDQSFGAALENINSTDDNYFAGLHPSKSLNGFNVISQDSLARCMRTQPDADTGANMESLFSAAVAQLSPHDQEQLYNINSNIKMPSAPRWSEFSYYLNLANAQDAGNGDVWRPVHF